MTNEWISIREAEPVINKHVLLFDGDEGICVGYYSQFKCYDHHPSGDFATGAPLFNVTHWMPLPEGPEGK